MNTNNNQLSKITTAHGSGGQVTHDLIKNLLLRYFNNVPLSQLADSALLGKTEDELVFTTDSHVISPLFFPGGNIGKLAVAGTVNDLAVMGATPRWLSCGLIIEEGFELQLLEKIICSMQATAHKSGVKIVTGDTKVVERGGADGIYINTAGIGLRPAHINLSTSKISPGDKVIINGFIGDHEAAILRIRENFKIKMDLQSDCTALDSLISLLLKNLSEIKVMRDPTRGGLATTLNEFTVQQKFGICIYESDLPIRESVKGLCEPLGFDPLYMANEGKLVLIIAERQAEAALKLIKTHPLGKNAAIIGEVVSAPESKVLLRTALGTDRILDMLTGVMLPRIC